MAPLLCAIGIMSYPPRHILETLKSWSQAVSLAATRKICEYLLPEVRFAANEVSVGDTLIAFDPECGGFHLVCTMVAMALILGSNMVALAILVKVLIVAGLLAIALNIARIVSTLALTVFGYAEEALFEIHREIGHGFAFLGILAIIGVIRWFEGKLQVKSQVSSVC
jgi:exosortase/archaeosortase family protein